MATKLNDDHSNADQVLAEANALDEAYASATGPAEAYDRDLLTLVQAAQAAVKMHAALKVEGDEVKDLAAALEAFEPWLEQEDNDPRAMGWVDDKGRP